MFERVKELLVDVAGTDESIITPDAKLIADLGLNSFDMINLIVAFEDEFDIEVPDKDIHKLTTVEDIVEYVEAHGAAE